MKLYDKKQVADSFSKAADQYDASAALQVEVGSRLISRLEFIKLDPKTILDLGCGTGALTRMLAKQFPNASITGLDLAPGMVAHAAEHADSDNQQFVVGDAEKLDFPDNHFDFIYSSLMIHWANDIQAVFDELFRVLKPDGLFLFSSLGPDTLKELRLSWREVDDLQHVHPFIDMHHLGDGLLRSGFADPVMDMEMITLTYPNAIAVMRDLKNIGAHNLDMKRHKALTGKNKLKRVEAAYEQFRRDDGTLPLSYEVVYGHAWGQTVQAKGDGTEVFISVDSIKKASQS